MSGLEKFFKKPPKKAPASDQDKVGESLPENASEKVKTRRSAKKSSNSKGKVAKKSRSSPPLPRKRQATREISPILDSETEESPSPISEAPIQSASRGIPKFLLTCTNVKCKYKRILMKKSLTAGDLICPKCSSQMRETRA